MKYFTFWKLCSFSLVCLAVFVLIGCGSYAAKINNTSIINGIPDQEETPIGNGSVGDAVVPWGLQDMNHKPEPALYRSSDHPNGIFVLEGYFRSCGLCNWNAANVNALASEYSSQNRVQVLDVGLDGPDRTYQLWIEETEANHPVIRDAERFLINQLGFEAYPSVAIVDCHMKIRYKHQGFWEAPTQKEVRDVVEVLLKESCI